jgi:hypothetical protein
VANDLDIVSTRWETITFDALKSLKKVEECDWLDRLIWDTAKQMGMRVSIA